MDTNLQENPAIYAYVNQFLGEMEWIAKILLSFTVIFFIGYTVYQNTQKKSNEGNYSAMFVKIALVLLALATYRWWTTQIADLIIAVVGLVDHHDMSVMEKALEKAWASISNKSYFWDVKAFFLYFFLWLAFIIYNLAVEAFSFIQFSLQIIIWILGPISIVLSLLPIYRDTFKLWVGNFIAVNFWSVLYSLVVSLFHLMLTAKFGNITAKEITIIEIPEFLTDLVIYTALFAAFVIFIPVVTTFILPLQNLGAMTQMIGTSALTGIGKIPLALGLIKK